MVKVFACSQERLGTWRKQGYTTFAGTSQSIKGCAEVPCSLGERSSAGASQEQVDEGQLYPARSSLHRWQRLQTTATLSCTTAQKMLE